MRQFVRVEPTLAQTIPADIPTGAQSPGEGACQASAADPEERLALRMPWHQQINLPDVGEVVLGRSSPAFRARQEAIEADQVSREHARFFRDERGALWVEDLNSANGTYIDGVPVAGHPSRLRSGQVLRLALDVYCPVLRIDEYGEPVGGNDDDEHP
jgi:hypothetical protein